MDLFGLGGYTGSSSDSDSEASSGGNQGQARAPAPSSSNDTTSSNSSVDSAKQRAREADARLRDFASEAAGLSARDAGAALPPPAAVFDEVAGPPGFLDPEATRPIATSAAHGLSNQYVPGGAQAQPANKKEFDIARLAPLMKGQKRESQEARGPPGAVIEGKAKKYKTEEGVQYTNVQIAMMGGAVPEGRAGQAAAPGAPGPSLPPGAQAEAGRGNGPSRPQDVAEFLNKGEGAALMPRKTQDRKDKEKLKRQKGQTSVHGWKTEAEMVLRQQFDS